MFHSYSTRLLYVKTFFVSNNTDVTRGSYSIVVSETCAIFHINTNKLVQYEYVFILSKHYCKQQFDFLSST